MTDQVVDKTDGFSTPGPGNILANARQDSGLSVREVADKLHLLPRQVKALEANDYQQFNGDIFCKGYLKSYAILLGIDPEPLITSYKESRPATIEPIPTARPKSQIQRPAKGYSVPYWSLAAVVIVIVVLWIIDSGSDDAAPGVIDSPEVVVDNNVNIVPGPDPDPALELEPAVTENIEPQSEPVVAAEEQAKQQEPVLELNTEDTLIFSFTQDCWVEVEDVTGKMIFADLRKANQILELSGVGPFKVLLGYAPGVTLSYNDEPVAVVVNQNKDSARLTVGE